jgi:hypothetical protein
MWGLSKYSHAYVLGSGVFRYKPRWVSESLHDTLTVDFVRLDKLGETQRFVMPEYHGVGDFFFAHNQNLPGLGRWLIVAHSRNNWGCFIFRFWGGLPI